MATKLPEIPLCKIDHEAHCLIRCINRAQGGTQLVVDQLFVEVADDIGSRCGRAVDDRGSYVDLDQFLAYGLQCRVGRQKAVVVSGAEELAVALHVDVEAVTKNVLP